VRYARPLTRNWTIDPSITHPITGDQVRPWTGETVVSSVPEHNFRRGQIMRFPEFAFNPPDPHVALDRTAQPGT
jgi:hypothetical protein